MRSTFIYTFVLTAICGAAFGQTASPSLCSEPRPQMCTQHFDPVCAQTADGTKKTASNGCIACTDKSTVSYIRGRCEADK